MNLGFIIVYVQDMDRAKAFYTRFLNMTPLEGRGSATFTMMRPESGSMVGLQDKSEAQFPPGQEEQSGSIELSFEVDDVDAVWQQWKDQGVEIVSEPVDLSFGRYFMAKDPDGHYLSAYRFKR